MNVKHYEDNPRSAIMVDFCFQLLTFCHAEAGFSDDKTSAFFSTMKQVFEHALCNDSDDEVTMEDSYSHFKSLVLRHSIERTPDSVGLFSIGEVQQVTGYISKSFYRHWRAYRSVFSSRQAVQRQERELFVETPLCPRPLAEAEELPVSVDQLVL
jgi:hypothetical protein